ncbi:hypothetical protein OAH62_02225, partial [Candidatus Marinimicrobia bacterium]|nr:hypothetical protein [Candidatus Neomarinimicrobiota bacterium]
MKKLLNLVIISGFIYSACPSVAPNSNYSFVEDDCGNCWLPYCYNMSTHEVNYDINENECDNLWVNPGDQGDPYYNGYCDSCPSGYTADSCGNCWNSYCYTFFSLGLNDDPTHSVYYDLTETECNDLGYNYYIPGIPGDPYFNSNCSDQGDGTADGGTTGGDDTSNDDECTDLDITGFGFSGGCAQAATQLGCDGLAGNTLLSVYCPVTCDSCTDTDQGDGTADGGTTGGDDTNDDITDCDGGVNGLGATDDCNVCHAQLCYNTVTHASMPAATCDGDNEMWASPDNPMNPYWNASCTDCSGTLNGAAVNGDLNSTGIINIADVVYLVNYILGATALDVSCGDMNDDGFV